jgi:hypothetical protein
LLLLPPLLPASPDAAAAAAAASINAESNLSGGDELELRLGAGAAAAAGCCCFFGRGCRSSNTKGPKVCVNSRPAPLLGTDRPLLILSKLGATSATKSSAVGRQLNNLLKKKQEQTQQPRVIAGCCCWLCYDIVT